MWDWIEERLPDEPVWFLDHVGVAPEVQGRGLGRRLIEHGIAMAQAEGLGAFLETAVPKNVPFYEELGFHVTTDGDVPGNGPHIWFMYRPPR